MKSKSVLVIGGGISGLAAANELLTAGYQVILVEAKGRLGGRIHTVYNHGSPVELGAEFLHGKNETFTTLIRDAGLSLWGGSSANRVLMNGRLQPVNLWAKATAAFQQARLREPDLSCAEFLRKAPLDPCDRRQVSELVQDFNAGPAERLSTHALLRADYSAQQMDGARQYRIKEGYGSLIDFLEQRVLAQGGRILLNTQVRKVNWLSGSVEALVQTGNSHYVLEADAAVVTLPLGVLKSNAVQFNPPLHEKRDAIEGMVFGSAVKIILLFKERWWSPTDILHCYDAPLCTWWSDTRSTALVGWVGGPKAEKLAGATGPQLESLALDFVSRLFQENRAVVDSLLIKSYSHNWTADEHIRGAYSSIPVNGLDLPKLLAAPLKETLFFAGEAAVTDAQTGMALNAYLSGIRAAREILETSAQPVHAWTDRYSPHAEPVSALGELVAAHG